MNALKGLVAAMGVLIVIGIGLVGYGLSRGKQPTQAVPQPQIPLAAATGPIDVSLAVPRGAKLEQMSTAGDRIVLRFSGPEGDKLVLVDAHSGKPAGTITLVPDTH